MLNEGSAQGIYVVIRIRPFVPREKKGRAHEGRCCQVVRGETVLTHPQTQEKKIFALDESLDSSVDPSSVDFASQLTVYTSMGQRILKEIKDGEFDVVVYCFCLQTAVINNDHARVIYCPTYIYSYNSSHFYSGFNTATFAYGQTGAGKTTSMLGEFQPPESRGILPRLLEDIFDYIRAEKEAGWAYDVRVRMLEIYNEKIQDLLATKGNQKKLEVRVHPKFGVYVPDLTVNAVESAKDVLNLIEYGHTMQTVAATAMNAHSSRGHTIFAIKMQRSKNEGSSEMTESSECFIVDLAGRENEKTTLATGERLIELSYINRSLFHLANCIHALGQNSGKSGPDPKRKGSNEDVSKAVGNYPKIQNQVPTNKVNFRNSKLTLILQEALSGNSKTFMVGCVSPANSAYEENHVTLRFAATVKNIKLRAVKNSENKKDMVKSMQAEISKLKAQIASGTGGGGDVAGGLDGIPRAPAEIEGLKEQLEAAQAIAEEQSRSWEE